MVNFDISSPVLVTGATGYVAGHLVKRLLEEGVTVHSAVRNPSDKEKLKHLITMAENSPGEIVFFQSDLLKEGSYSEAMKGCSIVFHTASPFIWNVNDPQKDLVDPALIGTRNVLNEVNRTESVQRVILTSSLVAIYGDNVDISNAPNGILTEEVWNTSSSLQRNPYSFSKTIAERDAWEIARSQSRWDMVVLNPGVVLGPGITPFTTSESFRIVKGFGDGTFKYGVAHLEIGAVDVRDLAEAHLAAARKDTAPGRYIVNGHNTNMFELAELLRDRFGKDYPLPKKVLPKWLAWLLIPLLVRSITREYISRNMNHPFRADNSKSINDLGLAYRPLSETINEMFQQMADAGIFKS